jgi:hypothetical protein
MYSLLLVASAHSTAARAPRSTSAQCRNAAAPAFHHGLHHALTMPLLIHAPRGSP